MRWRIIAALAVAGVVAGCGGAPGSSDLPEDPIDVVGTVVEVVDGRVESACFDFVLPEGYEISPYSADCETSLRMIGYDSLTEIMVLISTGDGSVEYFIETAEREIAEMDLGEVRADTLTIAGVPSGVVYSNNGWGLPMAIYFVPIETGYFTAHGDPITGMQVGGPIGAPEVKEALLRVVESLGISYP